MRSLKLSHNSRSWCQPAGQEELQTGEELQTAQETIHGGINVTTSCYQRPDIGLSVSEAHFIETRKLVAVHQLWLHVGAAAAAVVVAHVHVAEHLVQKRVGLLLSLLTTEHGGEWIGLLLLLLVLLLVLHSLHESSKRVGWLR